MKEGADEKNSYRNILKGTSIFGGVQVFQIAVSLIRGKFVALFLGPEGMGVSSLFNSSSQSIQYLGGLGLNLAIVKEVASKKNSDSFSTLLATARSLILISAIIAGLLCVVFASPLSRLTFGTDEYYWQFVLLGAVVFFGIWGQGLLSVIQGLHELKLVSLATLTGSIAGLIFGVPLYYLWGDKGIVPAMAILTFCVLIAAWIGVRKAVGLPRIRLRGITENKPMVKKLLSMGIVLVSANVIGSVCTYLINLFIRYFSTLDDVGLYQAANSITGQYSGVIFTAIMLDFFPRLSEAAEDNEKVRLIVNRQFEIVSLIAGPLISILICLTPLAISILLTDSFMPVIELIRWLALGVLIKALMFPLGYIALSKDNKRLFFWLEGIMLNGLTLILSCAGYYFFGLLGLGYSLILDCSICLCLYYIINHRLYSFAFSRGAVREGAMALVVCLACFGCSFIGISWLAFAAMAAVCALATVRSVLMLKRKLR